ncbi:MAG: hypothetical protein P9L99_13160 [Candidatus Lernaella stagnicola]|nr:hypothetical protein [Candidatus Lernaella stagnicola]
MRSDYRGLLNPPNREPVSPGCVQLMWVDLLLVAIGFFAFVGWGSYYGKMMGDWGGMWPLTTHVAVWTTNHIWTAAGALGLVLILGITVLFGYIRHNRWRFRLLLLALIPLMFINIMMFAILMWRDSIIF